MPRHPLRIAAEDKSNSGVNIKTIPGYPNPFDPAEHDVFGSNLKPPCRNYIIHESVCSTANMSGKEADGTPSWRRSRFVTSSGADLRDRAVNGPDFAQSEYP